MVSKRTKINYQLSNKLTPTGRSKSFKISKYIQYASSCQLNAVERGRMPPSECGTSSNTAIQMVTRDVTNRVLATRGFLTFGWQAGMCANE